MNSIYFFPERGTGTRFLVISKEDYSTELIGERIREVSNLLDVNGKIYYTESTGPGSIDTYFLEFDHSTKDVSEISIPENIELEDVVLHDGKLHVLAQFVEDVFSNSITNYLSVITPDGNLDTIKSLAEYAFRFDPILSSIGDNLIFADGTDEVGIELYALSYGGVNVEDQITQSISIYPNPSTYGKFYFGEKVKYLKVLDIQGKVIKEAKAVNQIKIDQSGIFVIVGSLEDGSLFRKKVIID